MKTITHILEVSKDKRTGIYTAVLEYSVKDTSDGPIKDMGWRSMEVNIVPKVGDIISEGV